jgi:hypothetical protein
MAKVLFLGHFPFDTNPCYDLSGEWRGLTLEQAMTAYWKVKSWSISINAKDGGGASGNLDVSSPTYGVPAEIETDLVCVSRPARSIELSVAGDATHGDFYIYESGFGFSLNFREFPSLYIATPVIDGFPVYINGISDSQVIIYGSGDDGTFGAGVSATISATSYWPYD